MKLKLYSSLTNFIFVLLVSFGYFALGSSWWLKVTLYGVFNYPYTRTEMSR